MQKPTINLTNLSRPIILSLLISLFWVIFLWNFWYRGVYALGINATAFLLLLLIFFNSLNKSAKLWRRENFVWLVPILFVVLSFGIYENPFIKVINILIIPALLAIFINYSLDKDRRARHWNLSFFFTLLARVFTPVAKLRASSIDIGQIIKLSPRQASVLKKIIWGLVLLTLMAFFVVIPLLGSADQDFALKLSSVFEWFANTISVNFLMKIFVFLILSLILYAIFLAWQKPIEYKEKEADATKMDSLVSGIVIGGILLLYLLFLWVQFARAWVNVLPTNFNDVEILVKSGFWQLMLLSCINIAIFFFVYRKTNSIVQFILSLFTIASLLLLASAGYRMFLYVVFYGFSYEKFYASYAVLYCAILFVYLMIKLFIRSRLEVIKFLVFLFLWMYGFVNIFPVEQFILRANLTLAQNTNSRINLHESSILSTDVLAYIEKHGDEAFMKINRHDNDEVAWQAWISSRVQTIKDKQWYEFNIVDIIYKLNKS